MMVSTSNSNVRSSGSAAIDGGHRGDARASIATAPPPSASATTNAASAATTADTGAPVNSTNSSVATTPHALDIEALKTQNIRTRQELNAWLDAQKSSLQREKAAHDKQTRDYARQSHDAQRKREALQQQQQALAASVRDKESVNSAHEVEIEVLQAEKSKKEPVLRELFVRNQDESQRLRLLVNESTELQSAQERQLAELQQGIAMYQRLGLFFEHTGAQQIIARFTQIDRNEPARVFSFRIRIDAVTDRFIVDECSDDVPAFDVLVDALNDSSDLALFIRSMRRQFKLLVD